MSVTDDDRARAMRAIYDAARQASGNNLALAIGATTGALAMLIQKTSDGPAGTKGGLVEMTVAKLRELTS